MANSEVITREDLKNVFGALGEGDYETRIDALEDKVDDMQYYITTVDWKSPQYTIASGSTLTVEGYDVSSVIPDGYDIIASIPLGSGSNQCYVYWCNSTADKKITYQIKNAVMSSISGYIWVRFILRKRLG